MAPPMARILQFISAIVGSIEDGQNHEIGEGAHPGDDVGVDGTAGAADRKSVV